jgi:oligoribonuclease
MLAIFLDIEATGLDLLIHRALEIACKIIDLSTGKELATYQSIIKQPSSVWEKRDLTSIEINGFTWEKVQGGQDEFVVQQEIIELFNQWNVKRGKAVYICQNPAFDRNCFSLLIDIHIQEQYKWPYHWLDFASMFWALQIKHYRQKNLPLPQEMSISKNAIAQHYHLPIEISPHSAMNGVDHLILCYRTVFGFG